MGCGCTKNKRSKVDSIRANSEIIINEIIEEEENVKVGIRVRNFSNREKQIGAKCVVEMDGNQVVLFGDGKHGAEERSFEFDYCFWSFDGYDTRNDGYLAPMPGSKYSDQKKIFSEIGVRFMSNALKGFNSTLLVYGQTGSGKTYTMFGDHVNKGIVRMFFENIFKQITIKRQKNNSDINIYLSVLQLYNERLQDLIDFNPSKNLELYETNYGIIVPNMAERDITEKNYNQILSEAMENRTTAETKMNETSSRSHAIIIIKIEQIENRNKIVSSINLVDLAGSEWNKKTQTEGIRFDEAKSINKSMTFLSQCLNALAEGRPHIPYRNSKLTLFLKNSIKDNGKTMMLATISPADDNYSETLSTLRYAESVKRIVGRARVNYVEDAKDALIAELKRENERLRAENTRLMSSLGINSRMGSSEKKKDGKVCG